MEDGVGRVFLRPIGGKRELCVGNAGENILGNQSVGVWLWLKEEYQGALSKGAVVWPGMVVKKSGVVVERGKCGKKGLLSVGGECRVEGLE